MVLHRYGDFRVEVFYFDSPCRAVTSIDYERKTVSFKFIYSNFATSTGEQSCVFLYGLADAPNSDNLR